jgi:hypothetical protein
MPLPGDSVERRFTQIRFGGVYISAIDVAMAIEVSSVHSPLPAEAPAYYHGDL